MAIKKETNWYVRAGGAETNGGGYDATNYPGGTNYADQDAAQMVFSAGNSNQLSTSGANATTLTSAGTPFTSQMVGNCIRISGGTNFQTGYYFITAFTDSSNVILDRTPSSGAAGSVGNGSLGGAHASLLSYANGGTNTQPVLATPLAAGHTINIRGSGSNDPAPGSPDYTFSNTSYWQFPGGDTTSGKIKVKGYNGRPEIATCLLWFGSTAVNFENIKIVIRSGSSFSSNGFLSATSSRIQNVIVDLNGQDHAAFAGISSTCRGLEVYDVEIRNSGGGAAGTVAAIGINDYAMKIINCWIHGVRGDAVQINCTYGAFISGNIIANCGRYGLNLTTSALSGNGGTLITVNTIDANGSDGVVAVAGCLADAVFVNNIISNHTGVGKYGINVTSGTTGDNDFLVNGKWDYNNLFGNTAARNNLSAGAHDVALDPQYVNAGANNYMVGTNMKAIGRPTTAIGAIDNPSATLSYVDLGAAQRQETGGGGGSTAKSFTFG